MKTSQDIPHTANTNLIIAERLNRTLKERMWHRFTAENTRKLDRHVR